MMRNLRHGAVNTPISGWHSSVIIYLEFTVNIAMIRRFELIPPPDLTPKKGRRKETSQFRTSLRHVRVLTLMVDGDGCAFGNWLRGTYVQPNQQQ